MLRREFNIDLGVSDDIDNIVFEYFYSTALSLKEQVELFGNRPSLFKYLAYGDNPPLDYLFEYACELGKGIFLEYLFTLSDEYNWNKGMRIAIENGHSEIAFELIRRGADNWNWGFVEATKIRNIDLVEFFLQRGANDIDNAFIEVAGKDNLTLLQILIDRLDNIPLVYRNSIARAASEGHIHIMQYIMDNLTTNERDPLNWALYVAMDNNQIEAVRFLLNRGANDFNTILKGAAKLGNEEMIQLAISLGANDWIGAAIYAAWGKNPPLVYRFIERAGGIENVNMDEILDFATRGNANMELIEYAINNGANPNIGLSIAVMDNNRELINFYIDREADDWFMALYSAIVEGHIEWILFFIDKVEPEEIEGVIADADEYPNIRKLLIQIYEERTGNRFIG